MVNARLNGNTIDKNYTEYTVKFYLAGIDSVVNTWIKNNFNESEEDIANLIVKLCKNSR